MFALNGMRFLSMTWICVGHTFDYYYFAWMTWTNLIDVDNPAEFIKEPLYIYEIGVDTFFAMGGILLAYITLQELDTLKARAVDGVITAKEWIKFWALFYIHRYLRLAIIKLQIGLPN